MCPGVVPLKCGRRAMRHFRDYGITRGGLRGRILARLMQSGNPNVACETARRQIVYNRLRWSGLWFILVALSVALSGCVIPLGLGGDGAPIACMEQVIKVRHKKWAKNNHESIKDLKELASRQGWKLLAAGKHSVRVLDLSGTKFEDLYSTKNYIEYAGIQSGNRIALIETVRRPNRRTVESAIVILEEGNEVLRIPLEVAPRHGSYVGGSPVLATDDYVVYPEGLSVVLYDVK